MQTQAMNTHTRDQQFTDDDARWAAIAQRDESADGKFYYAVRTTGVYCRPSCGSRRARRENVDFYETRQQAERAGFRPCKRCKPDQESLSERHRALVLRMCALIEDAPEMMDLDSLARAAGMSPYHFHRVFKSVTGITPKAYATARRNQRVRDQLARSGTVTEAIYDAGFNSSGRFYSTAADVLGMTPTEFRSGGTNTRIRFAVGECSLGAILVAATGKGICAISLGDDPDRLVHELQDRFPHAQLTGGDREFEQWVANVIGFVEAPRSVLDVRLDVHGTAFQQRVWQALREIPAGSTASYAEIARRLGAPKSARAVAQACAANPVAVAIPCHRVVRTDGALSGYRWGVERKKALLERESGT